MDKMELHKLCGDMALTVGLMQDQEEYWLDQKTKLLMDAEIHNKMIASLVSNAERKRPVVEKSSLAKLGSLFGKIAK